MAKDQVLMSWQSMESAAKTCDKQSQAIEGVIRDMNSLLAKLQNEWKGDASDAYAERWNGDLKKSFQDADKLMQDIATALRKTAKNYKEMDEAAGRSLRNKG